MRSRPRTLPLLAAATAMAVIAVMSAPAAASSTTNAGKAPARVVKPNTILAGYGPADIANAYNLPSYGGSGATVAIVAAFNDLTAEADLTIYRSYFGLPACTVANGCLRIVNQNGATSPLPSANPSAANLIAPALDAVSAACSACHLLLVEANSANNVDIFAAEDRAVVIGAKFIANTWSTPEYPAEVNDDAHFNHSGVVITAGAGDGGYGTNTLYPAVSPYVVAVGSTSLTRTGTSRWSESAWQYTDSACSLYEPKPAWQQFVNTNCPRRAIADVSAMASPGLAVYQNYGNNGTSYWIVGSGTGVAAALIAGVYALAGTPTAGTYPPAYPYAHSFNLYDIISGTNGGCGAPMCVAGAGWDGPTGMGAPNGTSGFIPLPSVMVTNPGTQVGYIAASTSLTLAATGGASSSYTWTSTTLPAGLSLNGGVISGTPTATGTTSVTVTAHDVMGSVGSATFNWQINPIQLSLSINGPGVITVKSTYTYTAVPVNFTNPTYAWSERFCADSVGTGCTPWTNLGSGASVNRVLSPDCSGTGTNTYWVQATATNNDGRQVTAQLITSLCLQ